jgi:hypothetical protein
MIQASCPTATMAVAAQKDGQGIGKLGSRRLISLNTSAPINSKAAKANTFAVLGPSETYEFA